MLKGFLYEEIEKIPEYLDSLESKERLDIIIKLLNYAIPKVNSVHYKENEPSPFNWDDWLYKTYPNNYFLIAPLTSW